MLIPVASSGQNIAASGDAWSYYRTVTVDNTGGAAHTDWPVKVSLTSGNFTFANADTNGIDLQFRATDGTTVLDYWREAYDDATDTATLWVNVPSVPSNSTVDVRLYYGNGSATDGSDGAAVFSLLFDDFTAFTTSLQYGRSIGNVDSYNVISTRSAGTWKNTFRERSKVLYDPDDADPDLRYKCYYTGRSSSAVGSIGLTTSPDGDTWTEYVSNPVISNGTSGIEDPDVLIDSGGTYHLFCESDSGVACDIDHFTSSDGISWTADPANPVIAKGAALSWDVDKVGTPTVWIEGSTWYMLYDGRNSGDQNIGLATSSDGSSWTKSGNNPIIDDSVAVLPFDVQKIGSTYYALLSPGADTWQVWSTTDAVGSWGSSSFTKITGDEPYGSGINFFGESGTRVIFNNLAETEILSGDLIGNASFEVRRGSVGTQWLQPQDTEISTDGGLTFQSLTSAFSGATTAHTAPLGVTSDFALGFRMSKTDAVSNDQYARIMVGDGTVDRVDTFDQWRTFPNGYGVLFAPSGSANSQLREVVSASQSNLGSTFTASADDTVASSYELRYLSTGALSFVRGSTSLASATDSTHVSLDKGVCITQGGISGNGANSKWYWVYIRPYDGLDPSASLGSETST